MPRDYKSRVNSKHKQNQQQTVAWWKWLIIALLVIAFVYFLVSLKNSTTEPAVKKAGTSHTATTIPAKVKKAPKTKPKIKATKKAKPHYDFYTLLPTTEVAIPESEIKTRSREEYFGKRKNSEYIIQAGSFRQNIQADKLRGELILKGFSPRIEKASIKGVAWNRVQMGPYQTLSQVASLKKRLKRAGVSVMVIEAKH